MSTTINNPNQIRKSVGHEVMKKFHRVSTLKGIGSVLFEWMLIIGVVILCETYFYWPIYVVCVVVIGARFLAIGLIMHEAVHQLISPKKGLNDWIAELLCAWPLFISMRSYRIKHLAHHSWLNTDQDPDYTAKTNPNWQYPMRMKNFLKIILVQFSGLGIFESFIVMSSAQMKTKKKKTPFWYHLLRVLFYATIITSFILAGKGMFLVWYWIIPFATWTQVANRLRRVAEHSGIEGKSKEMQTRTTIHGFFGRFLLAPKNISYHNEHHLYPGVPCYFLPKVHQELMRKKVVKENLHISKTYVEVYKDCITEM
ncbi:MAG: fatty acid desaturase family protein [Flavobacteriales bacterium]|nr:fatty acid desaturase family protein [Flavobacteriales bacterium]